MNPNLKRQFRPVPTGDAQTDMNWRRAFDLTYDNRENFGPATLFSRGTLDSVTIAANQDNGFGVTIKLSRPGTWIVQCSVNLSIVADPSQLFTVSLYVDGTRQPYFADCSSGTDGTYILVQNWNIFANGGELCVLYVRKDGGGGTSAVLPKNCTMIALWQGTVKA